VPAGEPGSRAAGRRGGLDRAAAGGLAIRLAFSKTDREAQGDVVGVPYASSDDLCPVRAYRGWLARPGITEGPAFRSITRHGKMDHAALSTREIALIVKRSVVRALVDEGMTAADAEAMAEEYSDTPFAPGMRRRQLRTTHRDT
jgi:hypothetical protein